jgi:hypothetical protein
VHSSQRRTRPTAPGGLHGVCRRILSSIPIATTRKRDMRTTQGCGMKVCVDSPGVRGSNSDSYVGNALGSRRRLFVRAPADGSGTKQVASVYGEYNRNEDSGRRLHRDYISSRINMCGRWAVGRIAGLSGFSIPASAVRRLSTRFRTGGSSPVRAHLLSKLSLESVTRKLPSSKGSRRPDLEPGDKRMENSHHASLESQA